jgi:ankyrin repeat protein
MQRHLILLLFLFLIGCRPTAPSVPIHEAAKSGRLDLVQRHIKAGTGINKKDITGWTPLHWAAMRGHAKVVEALVAGGADVKIAGLMNKTALNLAVEHQRPAVIQILQAAEAAPRGRGRPLIDGGAGVSGVLDN